VDLRGEVARRSRQQVEYGGDDRPVHKLQPLVSVLVITYQHAAFIGDCLDGILAQHTDFPFEIIIGEDGSDDGTRELCIEYADAHPDVIRLFLRDRDLTQLPLDPDGVIPVKRLNGRFTREAARADVLAFCEGDDQWTDPTKLQRQFDVLRADPAVAVVVHRAAVVWTSDEANPWQYAPAATTRLSTEDVIWDPGTPTCAVMLRSAGLEDPRFLDWSCRTLSVDYLTRAIASFHGSTHFIDREMAVHRKHPGGLSQSAAYRDRLRLAESTRNLYLAIRDLAPPDQRGLTNPKLAGVTGKLALAELHAKRPLRAAAHAARAVGYAVSAPRQLVRQRRRVWRPLADAVHQSRQPH
jgi:glycosyltransferase involved in cell wall biosynthesis